MTFDLIIRGGTVVDGTGQPRCVTDVGVLAERIAVVGDLNAAPAPQTVDAAGLVVAPGFIDIHAHSEYSLLLDPAGEAKVRQGVTTEVVGNCSYAPFPAPPSLASALQATMSGIGAGAVAWDWTDLERYRHRFNARGAALNVAPLAGHCPIRVAAMGYANRPPTTDELSVMERLLAETMEQGAFGFSAGLTLAPSAYAATEELVALCRIAARYGGFYAAHQRAYAAQQMAARIETLTIAQRAGIAVQMAHNNVKGPPFWHLVPEMLGLLERERAAGTDVSYDVYPYLASMSILDQVMPAWAQEGGVDSLLARLRDPATRQRIRDELTPGWSPAWPWEWDAIRITDVPHETDRRFEGKSVAEVAPLLGVDELEALLALVERRASATFHHLNEENTKLLLRHPLAMVASDSYAVTLGGASHRGKPHPRFFGTFPRVLGQYVREGVVTLEEAIHKMTSAPAQRLGLRDRGALTPGSVADIALFDPQAIADHATYREPGRYATGVHSVFVSGQAVLLRGSMTGALPGRALARA